MRRKMWINQFFPMIPFNSLFKIKKNQRCFCVCRGWKRNTGIKLVKQKKGTCSEIVLNRSFPVHPYSSPWKHQKILRWKSYGFLVLFLSVEKGWLRTNGLMLLEKSKSKKLPRLISTSNRMPSSAINNKFDECN